MFNLLGNFFFGGKNDQRATVDSEHENGDQTTNSSSSNKHLTEASTQTSNGEQSSNPTTQNTLTEASTLASRPKTQQGGELDWVIVDRTEEADKLKSIHDIGINTSMIVEPKSQEEAAQVQTTEKHQDADQQVEEEDDGQVLLGSFFERHENVHGNDCEMKEVEEVKEQKEWLITPLPCLTSITGSQRSIVENNPFENMLIEHPSMSVFVSATSASHMQSTDDAILSSDVISKVVEESKAANSIVQKVAGPKTPKRPIVIKKSASEKRKGAAAKDQDVPMESPNSTLRKKGRKHKKSVSPSPVVSECSTSPNANNGSANKENLQVKSLLMNHTKFGLSTQNKQEALLSKKNQMNRFNKIATFSSIKNVNNKQQRKHHKLQQPAAFQSYSAQY